MSLPSTDYTLSLLEKKIQELEFQLEYQKNNAYTLLNGDTLSIEELGRAYDGLREEHNSLKEDHQDLQKDYRDLDDELYDAKSKISRLEEDK